MLKTSRLKPENPMERAADMSGHFVVEERAWDSHKTTEQIMHKDVVPRGAHESHNKTPPAGMTDSQCWAGC